jgi:choice-of-anchor C domain-containing protein
MKALWVLAAVAAISASGANASTIINGGFDDDTPAAPFVTSPPTGWTVTSGSVDRIGSYWISQSGPGSIDLSGNNPGTLAQTFATIASLTYRVSFFLAGNPDGSPTVKALSVFATGGPTTSYTFDTTGFSRSNMGWAQQFYQFTATGTSTTLSFAAAASPDTPFGPALDSVSIGTVPEPATWGLMIFGFGIVGGAMRRRTPVSRPALI